MSLLRFRSISFGVLAAYLFTGVTSVRPGERAVVRRFGAVVATPGPGLWVGLPWGFERMDRVAVDLVRRVTVGYEADADAALPPGQLLTGDQNIVTIRRVIDYAVRPDDAAIYVAVRDRVDGAVSRAAEAALAEWVAARPVDDVLLTGKAVLPGVLTSRLRERLAPLQLGIDVQSAGVAATVPAGRGGSPRRVRRRHPRSGEHPHAGAGRGNAAENDCGPSRAKAYDAEQQRGRAGPRADRAGHEPTRTHSAGGWSSISGCDSQTETCWRPSGGTN